MTLTPKDAVLQYHLAERLKLDIFMVAHQLITIPTLKKEEKPGAKRILVNLLEVLTSETEAAAAVTKCDDFKKAAEGMETVIALAETNQFGLASDKSGEAMIPITTAAAEAFEVLSKNGLL
ncbi:MAG: hypothetical protein Q4Q53_02410 [Methanocorpusculum sp.]|nr:hypothetical protein [Methanocorpusculum sp.]